MSRQSVWPSAPPPTDHLNYLENCITATEGCVQSLTGALGRLEPGIRDFPRLSRVFANEHVRLFLSCHLMYSCPLLSHSLLRIRSLFYIPHSPPAMKPSLHSINYEFEREFTDKSAIPSLTTHNNPNRTHNPLARLGSSNR
jgi:hypothetical protein